MLAALCVCANSQLCFEVNASVISKHAHNVINMLTFSWYYVSYAHHLIVAC